MHLEAGFTVHDRSLADFTSIISSAVNQIGISVFGFHPLPEAWNRCGADGTERLRA